jgi:putative sterol carrier protein
MAFRFPSVEWAAAYKDAINASDYRVAGAGWTHGAVALLVQKRPELGLESDVGIWLELDRGSCREARVVDGLEASSAPFVISAEYDRWKQVIHKELEPIRGIMQRKLEIQGNITALVRHVQAAKELVECAARVPTQFLDE